MPKEVSYEKMLKKIAKNIKLLRGNKGLTQEDMVSHGFNYRHYQKLESGEHSPSLSSLHRLAKVFNTTVSDILK